jgi:eukaryotic-like serine/threonine-protein kinase
VTEAELQARVHRALIDRYRITGVLGRGGMATVFLAEDLHHQREVAVKVLDPVIAASVGAGRFLREIEFVARLQHPHILPLFDSGESSGLLWYVMPMVRGESLRARLDREGELPIRDVIRILRDVTDALAHAHAAGIIHRDIKPENILLADRHALVADFGIARAIAGAAGEAKLTSTGFTVGTVAYMAPEQAVADPAVDSRADLYSLGVIGYEMLTGTNPFAGGSPQATVAAHLAGSPEPPDRQRPVVPPRLAAAVMRCLAKRPADRWATAAELLQELEAVDDGRTPTPEPVAVLPRPRRWLYVAGPAAVLAVLAAGLLLRSPSRASVTLPVPERLTFHGDVVNAALSPDGKSIALLRRVGDSLELAVQDRGGGNAIPLAVLSGIAGYALEWSPDGTELLVGGTLGGRRGIHRVPRLGGGPRVASDSGYFAVWSPDGRLVASWSPVGAVQITELATGATRRIPSNGEFKWLRQGSWSADGSRIAFAGDSAESTAAWVLDIATARFKRVAELEGLGGVAWNSAGDGLYLQVGGRITHISLAPSLGGGVEPTIIAITGPRADQLRLADGGRRLTWLSNAVRTQIWLVAALDPAGSGVPVQLTRGSTLRSLPAFSPDGGAIAWVERGPEGLDLYRMDLRSEETRRLTYGGTASFVTPAWSPRADSIALMVDEGGSRHVGLVDASGQGPIRVFAKTEGGVQVFWAPGDAILYQRRGNRNFRFLDPATGDERPLIEGDSVGFILYPRLSPDGRLVAAAVFRNTVALWLVPVDSPATHRRIAEDLGDYIEPMAWSADGRAILVYDYGTARILRIGLDGRTEGVVGRLPFASAEGECDIHVERQAVRAVCARDETESDLWAVTLDSAAGH